GRAGLGGEQALVAEQGRQGQQAHAAGGRGQEIASGLADRFVDRVHGSLARSGDYSRVTNSSRVRIVRASATRAPASGPSTSGAFHGPASFAAASGADRHWRNRVSYSRPSSAASAAVGSRARPSRKA